MGSPPKAKITNAKKADTKKIINDKIKPVMAKPFNFLLKPIAPNITPNNEIIVAANGLSNSIKLSKVQLKDRMPQIGVPLE